MSSPKKRPSLPPLGWRDHLIYLAAVLVPGALMAAGAVLIFFRRDLLVLLAAPEALAASDSRGLLLPVIAAVTLGVCAGLALERWEWRHPILGAPGQSYGGAWDPIYPLTMNDPDAPEAVRKSVSRARGDAVVWGTALVLGVVLLLLGLTGGTFLYPDGSIQTLQDFGQVDQSWEPEQIDRVIVRVEQSTGRRSLPGKRVRLTVTFRTADNELISFNVQDFRGDKPELEWLEQLLLQFPAEKLTFENAERISLLCEYRDYSPVEQVILEELFGVTK